MKYLSVTEIAQKWGISERSVRNYCATGRIEGAFLTGKTWNIPNNAIKPARVTKKDKQPLTLIDFLILEKKHHRKGGIYHKTMIELTYNSNHIEGSRLTHDQTRYIYETNTISVSDESLNIDDITETINHFRCIDYIIDHVNDILNEKMIKHIHGILKTNTSDSFLPWFNIGDYKRLPNEVGGRDTILPENVGKEMSNLISYYNNKKNKTLVDIIEFHVEFERIHPFQDGNGRVGRLIMVKECLKYNIVPFIISDDLKILYYRGLSEWNDEQGYLIDTCLMAQDRYKKYLDYFRIKYK